MSSWYPGPRQYLFYFYPRYAQVSFNYIAQMHVRCLRGRVRVQELDEGLLDVVELVRGRRVLLHPVLYALMGDRLEMYGTRIRRLGRLLRVKDRLGGFDTADTDQISRPAVNVLNQLDLVIVPSSFARATYVNSGVKVPVEVLPHGVPDEFLEPRVEVRHPALRELLDFKRRRRAVYVLHHCVHSGYRKGSDLVYEAVRRVQRRFPHVYLVIKRLRNLDPLLGTLRSLKHFEVAEELDWRDYASLYDVCDVCLVPSRGGGFEVPALEAIARGVPTLVTDGGCFKDYIQYAVPVRVRGRAQIFQDNPIHVGRGFEPDLDDLVEKLTHVVEHLDDYRQQFKKHAAEVRERYSWRRVGERLIDLLSKYGFI